MFLVDKGGVYGLWFSWLLDRVVVNFNVYVCYDLD